MSDSPLSDVMTEHAQTLSPDSYERFLALFRTSTIGIVGVGEPRQESDGQYVADGNLGAGRTRHGDGKLRIVAYADPEVALRNFGPRFNMGIPGEALLQMAASEPECEGIAINSAVQEISLVISKETAQWLLTPPAAEAAGKRSWWKRR